MGELWNKLMAAGLIDMNDEIVLETYENGSYQSVDRQTFESFFGNTDFSYEQLAAADQGKGYTRFFDDWKQRGIIN